MKRKTAWLVLGILLAVILVLTSCSKTSTPTTSNVSVKWNAISYNGPGNILYDGTLVNLAAQLKKNSGGRFELTLYPVGTLVSGTDQTKSIAQGIAQVAQAASGYDIGWIPEGQLLSNLPFSFTSPEQCIDFWYNYQNGAALKLVNDAYEAQGVSQISLGEHHDPMVLMTTFPITKLSDFQGKKIRASQAFADAIKATGAIQVTMPLGEVYTALQTKVLDGVFMALSALDDFKWKEQIKYVVQPEWMFGGGSNIEVNLNEWNKLPDDLKKIFTDTAREVNSDFQIPYSETIYNRVSNSARQAGVQFVTLSAEETAKMRNCTVAMWDGAAKLSPSNAKIVQMIKDYLKSKGQGYPGS